MQLCVRSTYVKLVEFIACWLQRNEWKTDKGLTIALNTHMHGVKVDAARQEVVVQGDSCICQPTICIDSFCSKPLALVEIRCDYEYNKPYISLPCINSCAFSIQGCCP